MWQTHAKILVYNFASQDTGPPNVYNLMVYFSCATTLYMLN